MPGRSRFAWINTADNETDRFRNVRLNNPKNCHVQISSWNRNLSQTPNTAYKLSRIPSFLPKFFNFRHIKLPLLTSGLFVFIIFLSGVTVEARTNGANRRTGEVLPYDPVDARAQAEFDLEQDLRREFVRGSLVNRDDMEYRLPPKKTYSVSGSLPRKFQCYSCMSLSYQNNWERLQHLYVQPKVFTNRCERPADNDEIPTVECSSVCVSLVEANLDGGVFLGFKYIRGCINRILMHDFNLSALRTHRFTQVLFGSDLCRSLSRAVLFNNPRNAPQVFGEVNLCACFGDRCNSATQSAGLIRRPDRRLTFLVFFLILFYKLF